MSRFLMIVVVAALLYGGRTYMDGRMAAGGSGDEGADGTVASEPMGMFDELLNQFQGKPEPKIPLGDVDDVRIMKFGATWCGPCRMLDKELKKFDTVKVEKIDVDESPSLAQKYDVGGIPKLVLLRGGRVLDTRVGYQSAEDLDTWVREKVNATGGGAAKLDTTNVGFPGGGSVHTNPFAEQQQ